MPFTNVRLDGVDINRRGVRFVADHGNGEINCIVSFEAMDDAERTREVPHDKREAQFERLQPRIVEAAARKYFVNDSARGKITEIFVKSDDLRRVPVGDV